MNTVVIFQMVILSLRWLFGGTLGCHSWLGVLLTSGGNRLGMWLYILQCMDNFPLPPASPTQQRIIQSQILKVRKLENPDLEWCCWTFLFQRKSFQIATAFGQGYIMSKVDFFSSFQFSIIWLNHICLNSFNGFMSFIVCALTWQMTLTTSHPLPPHSIQYQDGSILLMLHISIHLPSTSSHVVVKSKGSEVDRVRGAFWSLCLLALWLWESSVTSLCSSVHKNQVIELHHVVWSKAFCGLLLGTWTVGTVLSPQTPVYSNQNYCNDFLTGLAASSLRII